MFVVYLLFFGSTFGVYGIASFYLFERGMIGILYRAGVFSGFPLWGGVGVSTGNGWASMWWGVEHAGSLARTGAETCSCDCAFLFRFMLGLTSVTIHRCNWFMGRILPSRDW